MGITLVRHTTPAIEKGVCYGQSDLELESSYAQELEKIQKQIPDDFQEIFSSPLKRCSQLANDLTSQEVITDKRLLELNFGKWELKKWNEIPSAEIDPWYKNYVYQKTLGGESYIDLFERVHQFYNEIIEGPEQNCLIVTHAGVIRAILALHKGITLKESLNQKLKYGEVIQLDWPRPTSLTLPQDYQPTGE